MKNIEELKERIEEFTKYVINKNDNNIAIIIVIIF